MDWFRVSDKVAAVFGAISVGLYLAAIAITPAPAPDSESPGVALIHYATVHRSQLLASFLLFAVGLAVLMVFAAGIYRIIRRKERNDGWLAMASLASVVASAGIFGAGTALFMVVAYRPGTDPAVVRAFWDAGWLAYNTAGLGFSAWIAIVVAATLSLQGAAAVDCMDRGARGADRLRRSVRREGRNGPVLSAGLVRPGRGSDFRCVASRRLSSHLAINLRGDHLTTGQGVTSRNRPDSSRSRISRQSAS